MKKIHIATTRPDEIASLDWAPLVERIRQKDGDSIDLMYRTFHRGLLFMFTRQLGPEEAEDSVHHCIAEVISAIQRGGLDQPERMAGFVLVIAKRHIAHRIAARVKSRRTECAIGDTGIQLVGRGVSPEKMASLEQTRAIARKVLSRMRPQERAVLTRFYFHEEPQEVVCRELGITSQQFKNTKHRAKARFADLCESAMNVHKIGPSIAQPVRLALTA